MGVGVQRGGWACQLLLSISTAVAECHVLAPRSLHATVAAAPCFLDAPTAPPSHGVRQHTPVPTPKHPRARLPLFTRPHLPRVHVRQRQTHLPRQQFEGNGRQAARAGLQQRAGTAVHIPACGVTC